MARLSKNLSSLRVQAKQAVDEAAEIKRHTILTPGDGQQTEYERTLQEAIEIMSDGAPADANYPALAAERDAQITSGHDAAATLTSAATTVRTAANWDHEALGYNPIMFHIKRERRIGKLRIDAATNQHTIEAARDQAIAAIHAL